MRLSKECKDLNLQQHVGDIPWGSNVTLPKQLKETLPTKEELYKTLRKLDKKERDVNK